MAPRIACCSRIRTTTLHHPQHSVTPITALPIRRRRLQYPPEHRAVEEFLVQKRVSTVMVFEQSTMRLFVKLLANFSGLASADPWANHVRANANCQFNSHILLFLFLSG